MKDLVMLYILIKSLSLITFSEENVMVLFLQGQQKNVKIKKFY